MMTSPNWKSDFNYSYTNCPKISIEILKKYQKSLRPILWPKKKKTKHIWNLTFFIDKK